MPPTTGNLAPGLDGKETKSKGIRWCSTIGTPPVIAIADVANIPPLSNIVLSRSSDYTYPVCMMPVSVNGTNPSMVSLG